MGVLVLAVGMGNLALADTLPDDGEGIASTGFAVTDSEWTGQVEDAPALPPVIETPVEPPAPEPAPADTESAPAGENGEDATTNPAPSELPHPPAEPSDEPDADDVPASPTADAVDDEADAGGEGPADAARDGLDGAGADSLEDVLFEDAALDGDEFLIGPLAADGAAAPYAYWTATDLEGNLVPGATFEFNSRSRFDWNWSTTNHSVADCQGTCGSNDRDRDSDGGEYLVKYTGSSASSGTSVSADTRYRVRPVAAPAGY